MTGSENTVEETNKAVDGLSKKVTDLGVSIAKNLTLGGLADSAKEAINQLS